MNDEQQQQQQHITHPERQEVPRHFLSICVCVKDERPFMAEFVQHYLAQGADHIYIIDNGSSDGLEEEEWYHDCLALTAVTIIRDARDMRILTDNTGGHGHSRLLTENLFVRLRNQSEWAAVVDADEFMFGKNGHTLRTYLLSIHASEINRVYVHWNIITPEWSREEVAAANVGDSSSSSSSSNNDFAGVRETFSLAQNRCRVNYDVVVSDGYAQFAGAFGKSLFRPRATRLEHGLWLHKVAVDGLAVTNYRPTEPDPQPHIDNGPPAPLSEAAYAALDVSMHHYALRHRADCAKKHRQLTTMDKKTPFVLGLFELLRRRRQELEEEEEADSSKDFSANCSRPSKHRGARAQVVGAEEESDDPPPPPSSWFVSDVHLPAKHTTLVPWVAGGLDLVRFEGTGLLRLVGWAARLAGDGRAAAVRFVQGGVDHGLFDEEDEPQDLLAHKKEGSSSSSSSPFAFPVTVSWNQLVRVAEAADGSGMIGRLQMRVPRGPWWVTFMRVPQPTDE